MASTYERPIKFNYYQAILLEMDKDTKNYKETNQLFDVLSWLNAVSKDPGLKHRIYIPSKNTGAFIDKVESAENRFCFFRISKIRDNAPAKLKEGEEAGSFGLGDDEYFGEEMHILYDTKYSVFMIQNNRNSLSISALQDLMALKLHDGYRPLFSAIVDNKELEHIKKSEIRGFEIRFANTEDVSPKSKSLHGLISNFGRYGGITGTISIGLGYEKKRNLDNDFVVDLIQDIYENWGAINSAQVKMREDDMPKVEVVDLFKNLLNDVVKFHVPSKQPLDFDVAKSMMIDTYKKREALISSSVKVTD